MGYNLRYKEKKKVEYDLEALDEPERKVRSKKKRTQVKPEINKDEQPMESPIIEDYLEINPVALPKQDFSIENRLLKGSSEEDKDVSKYIKLIESCSRHVHIMCSLAALHYLMKRQTVFSLASSLSLVPPHLIRQFSPELIEDGRTIMNSVTMLCVWWRNSYKRPAKQENDYEYQLDFSIGLWRILRALDFNCRLIHSVQALHGDVRHEDSSKSVDKPQRSIFWCEYYDSCYKRWIPIDCLKGIVNDRLVIENPFKEYLFIVSVDNKGYLHDLTRRYTKRYFTIVFKKRRKDEKYFEAILKQWSSALADEEECELQSYVEEEPIPITLGGFQGHHKYMLERQLKRYEVFWPLEEGIVGMFRNEPVRLRSFVKKVRSKDAWYTQFGRVIKDGEEAVKIIKLNRPVTDGLTQDKHLIEKEQHLYGEWQTEPYTPAPVTRESKIPRNHFGNMDLFVPSMLPEGCAWIDDEYAVKACKSLEIDFVQACTSFSFKGVRAVPKLRGCVVHEFNERPVRKEILRVRKEIKEKELEEAKKNLEKLNRQKKRANRIRERLEQVGGENDKPEANEREIKSYLKHDNSIQDLELF